MSEPISDPASARSLTPIGDALVAAALKAGADAADAVIATSERLSVTARAGALEDATREETLDFGLRVLLHGPSGAQEAIVSASDPKPDTLEALAARAVAMAREAPPTPEAGLADPADLAGPAPDLALLDPAAAPGADALLDTALALEAAALAVPGVEQAEGPSAGWGRGRVAMIGSNGVSVDYESGSHSISVAAIAGTGVGMERDYAFGARRWREDLPSIAEIGQEAGERAVKRLSPKKAKTGAFPVVFEPRVAAGLVGSVIGALNGAAIARGSSFLKEKMGERILPAAYSIIDDPLVPRGLGSRPIDGDGLAVARKSLVADGVVAAWLLDLVSARRLGLSSNGSAARGVGSGPSPATSNAWLTPGKQTPEQLIGEIEQGLFVTEMMGRGLNPVTGDYSRGASGFWIENGVLTHPVSELTVAGAMLEMLESLTAASDLTMDRRIAAPTLRVEGMTIASE